MQIEKYGGQNNDTKRWDNFIDGSVNGTIFHKQKFLSYHSPNKFEDQSLIIKDSSNNIVALFPLAVQDNFLYSHPGSSYGGLVIDNVGLKKIYNILEMIEEYTKDKGFQGIRTRLPPYIFSLFPMQEIDFAFHHLGYDLEVTELTNAIPLQFMNDLSKESTKRSNRKANRNLVLSPTDKFDEFWEILKDNLKKYNTVPTHNLQEIRKLKKLFPKDIKLFGAFRDEELIAGIVIFVCNERAIHSFYIAQNYDYQDLRPVNGLIQRVSQWAYAGGYQYFNLGISTEDEGKEINLGLFRFKEGFGAKGVLRKTYVKRISHSRNG